MTNGTQTMNKERSIKILKYFNDIDGHIDFTRRVLREYEDKYYGLHSGNPSEGATSKTNRISNPTETAALNIPDIASEKMNELCFGIEQLRKLQTEILTEICKLPLVEKNIITYFYLKGFQWVQISMRVNFSETQCKKIRNRALEKLGGYFEENVHIKNFNYPF